MTLAIVYIYIYFFTLVHIILSHYTILSYPLWYPDFPPPPSLTDPKLPP